MNNLAVVPVPMKSIPVRPVAAAPVEKILTLCSNCNLRDLCLPCGLAEQDMNRADELVYTRRRVKRGERLYRAGDAFSSLYSVRSGFFKTVQTVGDGRDQVTGFHMGGEIMGMDGIGSEMHDCDSVSLEDSEVCVIPYARLEHLTQSVHGLQRQFHKVMSREIAQERSVMLLLGTMRAEGAPGGVPAQPLAALRRSRLRSRNSTRMTREEIGSYLGLKLETVSRAF
jgi:CRP/FNR family transcriptional regulator